MKDFLKKIAIATVIVVFITEGLNLIYIRYAYYGNETYKFSSVPQNIMICNFGSSHGQKSFNYEDIEDISCFNFGLSSQTPSYDYRILENYEDNITEGAVVFIPISYFTFYGCDECEEENFLAKNRRYYRFLPPEAIKLYDMKTDVYISYFPMLCEGDRLIKKLVGADETFEEEWNRSSLDIDINEDAHFAAYRHLITGKLDSNGVRIVNESEILAVEKIIIMCQNMECRPVLITTPYLQEYTDAIVELDPYFYDDFYRIIKEIQQKTGVEYYDYAFDKRFNNCPELFMNSDHLNKEGARVFTNVVIEELVYSNGF